MYINILKITPIKIFSDMIQKCWYLDILGGRANIALNMIFFTQFEDEKIEHIV